MKRTKTLALALMVLGILLVVGGLAILQARAQGTQSSARWEYAWMLLPASGPPVFSRAEREVTILPSVERLSGALESVELGQRSYRIQTRSVRDDAAAALDIAGQDGWEAVAVVPYHDGLKVLLKRPL
jgi:hypothetical protein